MEPVLSNNAGSAGLVDGMNDAHKETGFIAANECFPQESLYNSHHEPAPCITPVAVSLSCRELDVLDGSLKKEQSIIDSSDSLPRTEEVERLDGLAGEEIVTKANDNLPVLSEDTLMPMPMHMYSRRKKGKNAGNMKSSHNVHSNEKTCKPDEQGHDLACYAGALHERQREQDLHHVKKVEKAVLLSEQESHALAACDIDCKEKSKDDFPKDRAKDASFKDKEGLKQHAKAKCALSPDKKRARDVEDDCAFGQHKAIVDEFLQTIDISESEDVAAVVESGKYAAVRAGLRPCTATSIEKARFKDVLNQMDGLQQYLECRIRG